MLFTFSITNGHKPTGPLAKAADGSFYGTTAYGGAYGSGTIYKIHTNGVHKLITSFHGGNGATPSYGITRGADGCFYGTTDLGGTNGVGTIFKLCGAEVTTLVDFGGALGGYPVGGLTLGFDSNLYGATARGPDPYESGTGTIFRINSNGVFSVLASFDAAKGYDPAGGVVQGRDGDLYGAMVYGAYLFRMTSDQITPLISFPGYYALVPLTVGSDGNIYGCLTDYQTLYGGLPGMIFRLVEPPRITSQVLSNGQVSLSWNSFTNGVYEVQYKASLESTNWISRFPRITATQPVTTFTDSPETSSGYYRIMLLP